MASKANNSGFKRNVLVKQIRDFKLRASKIVHPAPSILQSNKEKKREIESPDKKDSMASDLMDSSVHEPFSIDHASLAIAPAELGEMNLFLQGCDLLHPLSSEAVPSTFAEVPQSENNGAGMAMKPFSSPIVRLSATMNMATRDWNVSFDRKQASMQQFKFTKRTGVRKNPHLRQRKLPKRQLLPVKKTRRRQEEEVPRKNNSYEKVGPESERMKAIIRMVVYIQEHKFAPSLLSAVRDCIQSSLQAHLEGNAHVANLPGTIFERMVDIMSHSDFLWVFSASKTFEHARLVEMNAHVRSRLPLQLTDWGDKLWREAA